MSSVTLSDISNKIFLDRYALSGETKPEQMWERVAKAVAKDEPHRSQLEEQFYEILHDWQYVPGGRILLAMGNPAPEVTANNCYVIPSPDDSREGIMDSLLQWTNIQAAGGGVGINMSSLRPDGAPIASNGGTSSGPVVWAQLFAFASHDVIIQGGTRRGAAMIMIDDHHPDIRKFIHAKEKPGVLEGANLSICVSDAFMDAVRDKKQWDLHWGGRVWDTVSAHDLWREICEAAWRSGEPGIAFMERMNKQANSGYFETLVATNPCAEEPLGPYGACLLGSINLAKFTPDDLENGNFRHVVEMAVRFNDNIIDIARYPTPECEASQQRIRRQGIGVMGLADYLIQNGIRYGSDAAIRATDKVMKALATCAYRASIDLASERGPFPAFRNEYWLQPFANKMHTTIGLSEPAPIRNCYLTAQAPTGTIALMAGVNSGIEPFFNFAYRREDRTGTSQIVSEWENQYQMAKAAGRLDHPSNPFVTASDLVVSEHITMQAAVQNWMDSSVSKTINAPSNHTVDDVMQAYSEAYYSGLKSVAYYRDGSRDAQVLYNNDPIPTPEIKAAAEAPAPARRHLPADCKGLRHKVVINHELQLFIHTGEYADGSLGEIFLEMSKAGSTIDGFADVTAILSSKLLQHGVALSSVVDTLRYTRFEPYGHTDNPAIPTCTSPLDYVAQWLGQTYGEAAIPQIANTGIVAEPVGGLARIHAVVHAGNGNCCSVCGSVTHMQEGCEICPRCAWSKC